jgi:glycine betaine/proline transport system ATP-binding protein
MEGGRIVQCGTAREIIANPVSDYVADFVAHMNPLGVLTARDVMEQRDAPPTARPLPADMPVKDIMAMMSQGITDMVVQENGRNLGMIGTAGLMARLIDPRGQGRG